MRRSLFLSVLSIAAAGAVTPAGAQMMGTKKLSGQPNALEAKFIAEAKRYLDRHYATTTEAKRAGFVEFTPEDKTGAISWANRRWTSTNAEHPSQVWYDVSGRLIGADYSVLQEDSASAPHLWGIEPQRWIKIGPHIHYGIKQSDGSIKFGAMRNSRFADAGGSPHAPTKQVLVSMGLAKSPEDVAFVFAFPAIWDLQVWVVPNPDGAFAEVNPKVKPKNAQAHPT